MRERHIVAMGGGVLLDRNSNSRTSCPCSPGSSRPRVCFVPTAGGEKPGGSSAGTRFAARDCKRSPPDVVWLPSNPGDHLARAGRDLRRRRQHREHARDLARPRHRRDPPRGVERGIVLGGCARARPAGSRRASTTRSARSSGARDGLGLLPGSAARTTTARRSGGRVSAAHYRRAGCRPAMRPTTRGDPLRRDRSSGRSSAIATIARGYRVRAGARRRYEPRLV